MILTRPDLMLLWRMSKSIATLSPVRTPRARDQDQGQNRNPVKWIVSHQGTYQEVP